MGSASTSLTGWLPCDQSLVLRTEPTAGHPRFSTLETIREFGQERLADDGDLEQANLRAALRWATDAGEAGRAQEAAGALWRFWQQRGHLTEGRRWLEEVLAMASGQAPTAARVRALAGAGAGGIAWWQEDIAAARRFYEEALAVERELGDPARTADALYNLAFVAGAERDFEGAFRLFEESLELFRRAGVARADWMMALRDLVAGRPADARAAMEEARELFGEADSPMGMLSVLLGQSYLARWEERYQDAVRLAGAAASLRDQVGGRAPSTSWPASSATLRPRPGPTSPRTPPTGPGGRAAPRAWTPLARTTACR
jgi:tetratricopeptide (TPR) repeat protein